MGNAAWFLLRLTVVMIAAGLLPILPGLFKLMPTVAIAVIAVAEATRP